MEINRNNMLEHKDINKLLHSRYHLYIITWREQGQKSSEWILHPLSISKAECLFVQSMIDKIEDKILDVDIEENQLFITLEPETGDPLALIASRAEDYEIDAMGECGFLSPMSEVTVNTH